MPAGNQHSFLNLDGVRGSVNSEDCLSNSIERQDEEEEDEEEEEEKEEEEEEKWKKEKKKEEVVALELLQEKQQEEETCTRHSVVEPVSHPRHPNPLDRARQRKRARLEAERLQELRSQEEATGRGGGDQLVDLGNVRADAEEWQEFISNGEFTTEVNFRRVNGSNYRAQKVAVWPFKNILKFMKKGDFIIVYAPEGLDAQNIQRRLFEASGSRAIDFLRKIREATYEYVG